MDPAIQSFVNAYLPNFMGRITELEGLLQELTQEARRGTLSPDEARQQLEKITMMSGYQGRGVFIDGCLRRFKDLSTVNTSSSPSISSSSISSTSTSTSTKATDIFERLRAEPTLQSYLSAYISHTNYGSEIAATLYNVWQKLLKGNFTADEAVGELHEIVARDPMSIKQGDFIANCRSRFYELEKNADFRRAPIVREHAVISPTGGEKNVTHEEEYSSSVVLNMLRKHLEILDPEIANAAVDYFATKRTREDRLALMEKVLKAYARQPATTPPAEVLYSNILLDLFSFFNA